ncbi:hypothetical protein [Methanobrevibacter sp.]|uniref:hypothetical protein n=1 Tax=Methanobrevibacter sp. TaxID=66852 RepID=UPI0026E09826|nr:hypothetical protein [Methanobrevibacter sp.]MDO5824610.1 hypothetical protein [Methanobrevibacter sp.]
MNKILIACVAIVIIVLIAAGLNVIPYFDFYAPEDITQYTDLFDYSNKPITDWNDSSHEFKFYQNIKSVDNQDYENISIDLLFYNHGKIVGIESSNINKTINGTFNLNFTTKLDAEPNAFYYNVTDLNWA